MALLDAAQAVRLDADGLGKRLLRVPLLPPKLGKALAYPPHQVLVSLLRHR